MKHIDSYSRQAKGTKEVENLIEKLGKDKEEAEEILQKLKGNSVEDEARDVVEEAEDLKKALKKNDKPVKVKPHTRSPRPKGLRYKKQKGIF